KGLDGLIRPKSGRLYLGNSGTSLRLILGVLAGQGFSCRLSGDASLSRRPMNRVIRPLTLMGAKITASQAGEYAPLTIKGGALKPIRYQSEVASAQVKSAILLSGLYAPGETSVREPAKSRDHTERMLKKFGADISEAGLTVSVTGRASLNSCDLEIPADISAASFFLVGACINKDSLIEVPAVGLNPTRTAFLKILQRMGAQVDWKIQDHHPGQAVDEPKGAVTARYSHLHSVNISPEEIPGLIDELPILMVAATQAEGQTLIRGAGELRVKETDRIKAMVGNLTKMGAEITVSENDILIRGPVKLKPATVDSFNDHRTAMSMTLAALITQGRTAIKDIDCVDISFPGFFQTLTRLLR
ncbi:MAG: 3-phosphoshikimate 1-carboxyvinyltransferase, partial [Candidatus Omnitrophica bacterium]|nr:3-phosphoshikimate 1-carboxyvinyltransferase [Candidatus Omnitrophota bacterium]